MNANLKSTKWFYWPTAVIAIMSTFCSIVAITPMSKETNKVTGQEKLSLKIAYVPNAPAATLAFTVTNHTQQELATTPLNSNGNRVYIIGPKGQITETAIHASFTKFTIVRPLESMTWKIDVLGALNNRELTDSGFYRIYWTLSPNKSNDAFSPEDKFKSNEVLLLKGDNGKNQAEVDTREGKQAKTENEVVLQIAAWVDTPDILTFILNNNVDTFTTTPIANNNNRLNITKPDGQAIEHFVQKDEIEPVTIKPSESMTWKLDIAEVFKSKKLEAPGLYRVSWKIGEHKSNELLLLKEKGK